MMHFLCVPQCELLVLITLCQRATPLNNSIIRPLYEEQPVNMKGHTKSPAV